LFEGIGSYDLLFHIDTDGVCSGVLMNAFLERIGKEGELFLSINPSFSKQTLEKIKKSSSDTAIFVDLSVDSNIESIEEIASVKKVIVMDHHIITNNLNKVKNCYHFNPLLEGNEKYYPASKYIFDVLNKEFPKLVENLDWIACVGLIGDSGFNIYKDFVKKTLKKYDLPYNKDVYLTKFGEFDKLISSGRVYNGAKGAMKAFKILRKNLTINEFEKNSEVLKNWSKKVDLEIEKQIELFKKEKEVFKNIFFYQIHSKFNLGSPISSILGSKYKHKTIVIYENKGNIIKFHLRRTDGKVDLSKLAKEIVAGFQQSAAGGHVKAAGGHVLEKDWYLVKERMKELLKKD